MEGIQSVKRWLESLNPDNQLAIGEMGLELVELTPEGKETGAYYEIGGIPLEEQQGPK